MGSAADRTPAAVTLLALVAAAAVFVAGIVTGVLLEQWIGTDRIVDWAGIRQRVWVHRVRSAGDRGEVSVASVTERKAMVALVFGQSNAANSSEKPGKGHKAVYEYYRGRLYEARDPLLGAEGTGGSIWLRMGAKAVESDAYEAVILLPFAYGGTEIARWAPGGSLHNALVRRLAEAQASGLRFTHLLWLQGEADGMGGTLEADYRERFLAMLAAIRGAGVNAPVYIAIATRCARPARGSESIRRAQTGLVDPAAGIKAGPDIDTLGIGDRYDGCHFSAEGVEKAAELWWQAVRPQ